MCGLTDESTSLIGESKQYKPNEDFYLNSNCFKNKKHETGSGWKNADCTFRFRASGQLRLVHLRRERPVYYGGVDGFSLVWFRRNVPQLYESSASATDRSFNENLFRQSSAVSCAGLLKFRITRGKGPRLLLENSAGSQHPGKNSPSISGLGQVRPGFMNFRF